MSRKYTNIIDRPRIEGGRDLLGTDKYLEALTRFIQSADMPTTIAIQGEWGSGKTSMMNQIKHKLCRTDISAESSYHAIAVNTWQYSLMKTGDEALVAIIRGITKHIAGIISERHEEKAQQLTRKLGSALNVIAKAAAKSAISVTGIDGSSVVDAIVGDSVESQTILELRNALNYSVEECLKLDREKGDNKRGFLFFIDDLDRIDPPVAVEILELIKNIFEVDHCIFILAIDYDVVVKGLEPKFGKLTEKNEREFRSFFDKIIQLPFSMPLGSYTIDEFLIESLIEIGYLDENLRSDANYISSITKMALSSVGTNPRSIKRLINTLSLIQIINELEEGDFGESKAEKLINFGLVCLQISYPVIYEHVSEYPNFVDWSEATAQKLRLSDLPDSDRALLISSEEFDEEWEQVLYRMSSGDLYLRNRVFSVSSLLNMIRQAVPNQDALSETIERALSLSKITGVNIDTRKSSTKPPKDYTKYTFEGRDLTKGRLVLAILHRFSQDNPAYTLADFESRFPSSIQGKMGAYCAKDKALEVLERTGRSRHFLKEEEIIRLADHEIAVCSQWGKDNIEGFVELAKKENYL